MRIPNLQDKVRLTRECCTFSRPQVIAPTGAIAIIEDRYLDNLQLVLILHVINYGAVILHEAKITDGEWPIEMATVEAEAELRA